MRRVKYTLHKSVPGCCQKQSHTRGKKRHVSKNTVTAARLNTNTVLVKGRTE